MRAAILCGLLGCVDVVDVGVDTQAATTAFPNDQPAFEFFIGKGLTTFQAAGIVGNLDQESGVDPTSVQYGGGPGRGIAQWSVGGRWDTSPNDNVRAYASQRGESATSLNLQLEFIWYELTTIGYGYAQLRATTNVTDATVVFMDKYEICGTCAQAQRIAYANDVLAAYGAIPYAATYVHQSWPLASMPPFQLKCGESIDATITLKNTGTKPWDSSTKLGTTVQRDRASMFSADWPAPNRAAAIEGTVAPGADGTFTFTFTGPTGDACVPGTYKEHFGLVQEGVAWFADNGQGGPPDAQIEADIELVPGVPGEPGDPGDPGVDPGGKLGGGGGCSAGGGGLGVAVMLLGLLGPRRRYSRRQ